MFPETGWVKFFLSLIRPQNIYFQFKKQNKKTRRQKAKGTKEAKIISVENLTGYNDIVCEFAPCAFNLPDRVVNFLWLFI